MFYLRLPGVLNRSCSGLGKRVYCEYIFQLSISTVDTGTQALVLNKPFHLLLIGNVLSNDELNTFYLWLYEW